MRVPDAEEARRRLRAAGATLVHPRVFEDNRLYDDAQGTFVAREWVLRLRSCGGRHTVTFKRPVGDAPGVDRYKIRVEHETTVGDPDAFDRLLRELGFRPGWRYQKHRETYHLGDVEALLDETPIGVFVELEGAAEAIDRAATLLGFSPRDYITKTYRALAEDLAGGGDPGDLVIPDDAR